MYKNLFTIAFILVFTLTPSAKPLNNWYSPDTLTWLSLPPTILAVFDTAGAYCNGNYYQVCGQKWDTTRYSRIQKFNGVAWSEVGNCPGGGINGHCATEWNGIIVISGGQLDSGFYNYTSIFDPGDNSWIQSTSMPINSFGGSAMVSVNGKCYLIGGSTTVAYNTLYGWVPGESNMASYAPMPEARSNPCASIYNGKIFVFGGYNAVYKNTIYMYDPEANSWVTKNATLNPPCSQSTSITIGDRIYVVGGITTGSTVLNQVQVYNPINDTISTGVPLPYAVWGHASGGTIIPNSNCTTYTGKIYVSCGSTVPGPYPVPLATATLGTVTGVNPVEVEPTSLGNIKALYR